MTTRILLLFSRIPHESSKMELGGAEDSEYTNNTGAMLFIVAFWPYRMRSNELGIATSSLSLIIDKKVSGPPC